MADAILPFGIDLATEAFDLAAVLRCLDTHIEHFRSNSINPTEDDLNSFTRTIRVAYQLAEALAPS